MFKFMQYYSVKYIVNYDVIAKNKNQMIVFEISNNVIANIDSINLITGGIFIEICFSYPQ